MSIGRGDRTGRARDHAWIVVAAVQVSIAGWGVLALVDPGILGAGFQTHTGESWASFVGREPAAADVMEMAFRLVGALNVAVGFVLFMITVSAFRTGARWPRWTLLIGTTLAIDAPIAYDRAVGFIGVFEVLEYAALLAVYVALAVRWRSTTDSRPPQKDRLPIDLSSST